MDFTPSPLALQLRNRLQAFIDRYVLPYNAAWHAAVQAGDYPPPFLDDLKALAREEGLWNLFLPGLQADEPGTRLSNLDYAPLAEAMGTLPWAAEVFNCHAPDTGNMELLHRFATPAQRAQWLAPLLDGHMRSTFAMSEPDVASSDPTNLQTTVRRDRGELVIHGRKWFITGAAHPHCRLLIVLCRNAGEDGEDSPASPHARHSLVLVPVDAPGVRIVRNIGVVHHIAPEGHCEIVLQGVRVPADQLLGAWGAGFAMAQARLGPGRVHHCMRTIGQCELALRLAAERALERTAFGKPLADQANVQEWIAESRIEIIETPGPWIGVVNDISDHLRDREFTLAKGDRLILYTDGIPEAHGGEFKFFGLTRLGDAVMRGADTVHGVIDDVFAALEAHTKQRPDDQSLVVIEYK